MEKRKIRSLEVTPVGIGCMGFSHGYGQIPSEEYSIEAIQEAYDHGCNFFDTAESYSPNLEGIGHNEKIVGKALKDVRDNVVIATKFHITPEEVTETGSVYDVIKNHLEGSLERLQTDYVDLYYLHRINPEVSLEEIAKAMGKLIDEGLIKEWGLSQVDAETIKIANDITPVGAVQNLYNMVERDSEEEVIPFALEEGIAIVPFSPTSSGLLSGKITTKTEFEKFDDVRNFVPQLRRENIEANQPIINLVTELAEKKNATPAQISMAWMLKKYPNVIPIPGSKNKGRIIENLDTWNVELTDEEFKELDDKLNELQVYGHRGIDEDEYHSFLNKDK